MACQTPVEKARSDSELSRINKQYASSVPWGVRDGFGFSGPGDVSFAYALVAFQQWLFSVDDGPSDCQIDGLLGPNSIAKVRAHRGENDFCDAVILPEEMPAAPKQAPAPAPAPAPRPPPAAQQAAAAKSGGMSAVGWLLTAATVASAAAGAWQWWKRSAKSRRR